MSFSRSILTIQAFVLLLLIPVESRAKMGCDAVNETTNPDFQVNHGIADDQQFKQAIKEAECFSSSASSANAEWLETAGLIELARHAATQENWDQAVHYALKARFQALAALKQAEYEAEAWKRRVPR